MKRPGLKKGSLAVKTTLMILGLIILPLIIGLYASTLVYESGLENVSVKYAEAMADKAQIAISQYIRRISNAMATIYTPSTSFGLQYSTTMDYLSLTPRPGLDYAQKGLALKQFLESVIRHDRQYIYNAFLVDSDGGFFYANNPHAANNTKNSAYTFLDKAWFRALSDSAYRQVVIVPSGKETNDDNAYLYFPPRKELLLFARNVFDVNAMLKMHRVATLFVSVDAAFFDDCFAPQKPGGHSFYVLDPGGAVLYSTDSVSREMKERLGELVGSLSADMPKALDGAEGPLTWATVPETGWHIVGVVDKQLLSAGLKRMQQGMIFTFLAVLGLAVLVVFLLSRALANPLRVIRKNMKRVEAGLLTDFDPLPAGDEFGQINRGLIEMASNLSDYIQRSYVAELRRKEADLRALQGQINPHFMMNALESIRMHLVNKDDGETAQAVQRLARIVRTTLTDVDRMVTVREAVDFVREYVAFQQYRFGDRVQLSVSLSPEAAGCRIPRLLLQPLVENSFKHGLSQRERDGLIAISGYVSGGVCHLVVMDNGCGMVAEEVGRILALLDAPAPPTDGRHIGLKNVHDRLRHYFGEAYGLTLSSIAGQGTIVTVRLPAGEEAADG